MEIYLCWCPVGFGTGLKSVAASLTVGYPDVSPARLFAPTLAPVWAQEAEEEGRALEGFGHMDEK